MAGQYHMAWIGSLACVVALLSMGGAPVMSTDDTNAMVCYKPPPPANNSITRQDLFFYDAELIIQNLPNLYVTKNYISLSINNKCSVKLSVSYTVALYVVKGVFLTCKYSDDSSLPQTPLPASTIAIFHYMFQQDLLSQVSVTLTFDPIVAADPVLKLICSVKLPIGQGILKELFIDTNIVLKLQGCPHATHGVHCNQPCTCAAGIECHPFSGECVCPRGLQGETCNQAQPTLLRTGPSTVFVRFGEAATLTCIGYGMAPSQSRWEWNDTRLETRTSSEAVAYSPRPVYVSTSIVASSADINGVYKCSIVSSNEVYSTTVEVVVTDIPHPFLEAPSNQSVVLGSPVELRCRTKPEAGTVTWVTGNQTLPRAPTDGSGDQPTAVVVERNQTVSVLISRAGFADVGLYQCAVGHPGANDSAIANAWLTVESQGTVPSMHLVRGTGHPPSRGVLEVQEGEPLTVMCEVREAYPEPSIAWHVGDEDRTKEAAVLSRTSLNAVSYDVNSSLTFRPSWHHDGKRLACVSTVTNFQPIQGNDMLLNVSYIPKVTVVPPERTVQPGESPGFLCQAVANPPVSGYQWTLQGRKGEVIRRYHGRSVQIHHVEPDHNMASLTCTVMNDIGPNSSKAVIKVFNDADSSHLEGHWPAMVTILVILVLLMVIIPILVCRHRGKLQDLFFKHKNHNPEGKDHDVFVAYKGGGEEEVFVHTHLVPKLTGWGCDICIDYQNFAPGREIADNIMAAVASSRKTLLVLSPDFMASEWCYFEFMCAVTEALQHQTNSIIPLMFRDVRNEELCGSMRNLLDTVSFVPWPSEGAGACRGPTVGFWKLLQRAVQTEFNVTGNLEENADDDNNDDNDHIVLV